MALASSFRTPSTPTSPADDDTTPMGRVGACVSGVSDRAAEVALLVRTLFLLSTDNWAADTAPRVAFDTFRGKNHPEIGVCPKI